MDKQVFLVILLVSLDVDEGGVLKHPQSVGGDGSAQPGGCGRRLRGDHGGGGFDFRARG